MQFRIADTFSDSLDPFAHPDAQRRFRVMADVEALERALDYPWEKWTVFLHPSQRQLVEREYNGPESRVLLATFSDPLATALRVRLTRLIGNEPTAQNARRGHPQRQSTGLRVHSTSTSDTPAASPSSHPVTFIRHSPWVRRRAKRGSAWPARLPAARPTGTTRTDIRPQPPIEPQPRGLGGDFMTSRRLIIDRRDDRIGLPRWSFSPRGGALMNRIVLITTWLAIASSALSAAQPTGSVEIQVVDPFDAAVPQAEVVVTSISGYRIVARTDPAGAILLTEVVPGTYTVQVTATDFLAAQATVRVAERERAAFRLVLLPEELPGFSVTARDSQGLALPGVLVEASGPAGATLEEVTGPDGRLVLTNVRPGTWRVRAGAQGFRQAQASVDVEYGDRPDLTLELPLAGFGDTIVVTASRSPVRIADAPVSTSVVSADAIATGGRDNVGDLLRSVPGVNVVQLSARDIALTSRGATSPAANSQLVLVDGRSVYLDFFGAVLWDSITVNQSDIAQIEVVRGPASATWGANAMTGAVNIVTHEPRATPGTRVSLWGGLNDRNVASTANDGSGRLFGSNVTVTRTPSDTLAYRISAGHYRADALPRPEGHVPVIDDPRVATGSVGGAVYPAVPNLGTNQVKFDTRVDQQLGGGRGRMSYSGGVATTQGVAHTRIGPFDLEPGGYLGYAKLNYDRDALSVQFFTNFLDGRAPSLLIPDTSLGYNSQTFDAEIVHRSTLEGLHRLTYGGNIRRVRFSVDVAPAAQPRTEAAVFLQDEIDTDRYRAVLAARIDKFGNIPEPFVSPRLAFGYKFAPEHVVALSFNRAFRAPSAIEAFMEQSAVVPIDLSFLAAFRPLLPALVPPGLPGPTRTAVLGQLQEQLDATTGTPFPLRTRAIGGSVGFTAGTPAGHLVQESVTAYEVSYNGATPGGAASFGAAVYTSDVSNSIGLVPLLPSVDPYTALDPPPGWLLPPEVLALMAANGAVLPRTSFVFANLGPIRQFGAEAWTEYRLSSTAAGWFNYSWQAQPAIRDSAEPYPVGLLNLPPAHRLNLGVRVNGRRFLGNLSANMATRAFWADILTSEYHGYSGSYTSLNGSAGWKWQDGTITTLVRMTNILNTTIQQHIFGDLLRRAVVAELRLDLP